MSRKKKSDLDKLLDKVQKQAEKDVLKEIKKTQKPKKKKVSPTAGDIRRSVKKVVQAAAKKRAAERPEKIARENITRWNTYLKLLDKSDADINRRQLQNLGVKFTKSGNISVKNLRQNKKATEFFSKDKVGIKSMIKKRRKKLRELKKEREKTAAALSGSGVSYDDYLKIVDALRERGQLWYHTKSEHDIPNDDIQNIMIANAKNSSFINALGLDYTVNSDKSITIQNVKNPVPTDGYDITDIIR